MTSQETSKGSKPKKESEIQREICEALERENLFFWRSNNIPVYGRNNGGKMTFRALPKFTPKGIPDIMWVYKGKFIAFEVKRPGAKLRPEQVDFAQKCITNGANFFQVHSVEEALNFVHIVKQDHST